MGATVLQVKVQWATALLCAAAEAPAIMQGAIMAFNTSLQGGCWGQSCVHCTRRPAATYVLHLSPNSFLQLLGSSVVVHSQHSSNLHNATATNTASTTSAAAVVVAGKIDGVYTVFITS